MIHCWGYSITVVRFLFAIFSIPLFFGCASISEIAESLKYTRDTAITTGTYRYVINTEKCYEIGSISDEGVLDCYAEDGSQSAQVSPATEWQVKKFDESFDYEWGSDEHQAFLHYLYYEGGLERLASDIANSVVFAIQLHQTIDSLGSSAYDPNSSSSMMPSYGSNPAMKGMSVWDARGFSLADWHFNNATFFNFGGNQTIGRNGQNIQRIGNFGFHSNGLRSYYFGGHTYHSNGSTSISTSSISSYNNGGQNCIKPTDNIVRCFGR